MAAFGCVHAAAATLGGGARFAVRVLCGRWFMLFASTMIMTTSMVITTMVEVVAADADANNKKYLLINL